VKDRTTGERRELPLDWAADALSALVAG
jgi:hypothetical protein